MEEQSSDLQKQIEQRINELPLDIQEAVLSSEFGDKILAISTSAKLHIDQVQSLNDIAMLAMLGFMPLNDMQQEIARQLGLQPEIAQKIASEINGQIFLPIRESMKKFSTGQGSQQPASAPVSKPPLAEVLPKVAPAAAAKLAAQPAPMKASPAPAPQMSVTFDEPELPAAPAAPSALAAPSVAKIDMHPADVALTEKTVSMPPSAPVAPTVPTSGVPKPVDTKAAPPKPADYKADPYREPIN